MRKNFFFVLSLFSLLSFGLLPLFAVDSIPQCMDHEKELAVDNESALNWKFEQNNQDTTRALISGTIVGENQDNKDHRHFFIQIGENVVKDSFCDSDVVEVVYNRSFGEIPDDAMKPGAQVIACGDFIVSNEDTKKYKASPACALIHWVHYNPKKKKNKKGKDHGFLVIDGETFGY